jgi:hypothetical protein
MPMTLKAREYQTRATQCETRARKARSPKDREWQMVLASAYQALAEMEAEAAGQRQQTAA